jgi:hypothetical protein
MYKRNAVQIELDVQAAHEGETDNIRACRAVLKHAKTSSEWQALVSVKHHRYGPLSYETHRFYYLRDWVAPLVKELSDITIS